MLDVNEHEPEFVGLPYRATVPESTVPGTFLLRVHAEDRDQVIAGQAQSGALLVGGVGGEVRYRFADPAAVSRFLFDEWNGEIRLFQPLDYESAQEHVLHVVAYDSGAPTPLSSTATVRIEVLDQRFVTPKMNVLNLINYVYFYFLR